MKFKELIDRENYEKLKSLDNEKIIEKVKKYAEICKPAKITVVSDSPFDINYIRNLSLECGEEKKLKTKGHTYHFDGYYDQARDKQNTKVLVEKGRKLSRVINTIEREKGLKEVHQYLEEAMKGKEMLVRFFCLGPKNSDFSILALQITDSAYVAHSEDILYRQGYEEFKKNPDKDFFFLVHSAGKLDERKNSAEIDKRRIYIDVLKNRVFTVNNQYAGNSLGLKKLALRLAINKAHKEDWLCEHMFIMGVKPEDKNRTTYFTGAYPSACGKTSTAMIPGQSIIGDDIAYIRPGEDGIAYAANIEQGIFGIIRDVNPDDDPIIYNALNKPGEIIFSNILVKDKKPYWLGMGRKLPGKGENFSGEWHKGKKGPHGKEVPPAHKNARYTLRIKELENADFRLDDPKGVPVQGIIYGGRDSDTSVPVYESLSWSHGVFIGACLESETTAATLGKAGLRKLSPMANMDFIVVPLGTYIENHLKFGENLDFCPKIFSTNYFLKEKGEFLNAKTDKKAWIMWMEGRIHEEYDAVETPIGKIPKYEDIKDLFMKLFGKDFSKNDYEKQFSIRLKKFLEKLERVEEIYSQEEEIPKFFYKHLEQERERIKTAIQKFGKDVVSPFEFKKMIKK
ncbi:phosphoenolpyruvate carboxykinase (GTP) [Candidatus Woesearchaeota archaeon]|nr:phosphoenolpyruvate carboxykinase (GTP) [Candidatus Woesearchaeota archaeon]